MSVYSPGAVGDYAEAADAATLRLTGDLTLVVLMKLVTAQDNGTICDKYHAASGNFAPYSFGHYSTTRRPVLWRGNTSTSAALLAADNSDYYIPLSTWCQMVFHHSGTAAKILKDLAEVASGTIDIAEADGGSTFRIFGNHGTGRLKGYIATLELFNRALLEAEYTQLATNPGSISDGAAILLNWLDSKDGTDYSGNNNEVTFYGDTAYSSDNPSGVTWGAASSEVPLSGRMQSPAPVFLF